MRLAAAVKAVFKGNGSRRGITVLALALTNRAGEARIRASAEVDGLNKYFVRIIQAFQGMSNAPLPIVGKQLGD